MSTGTLQRSLCDAPGRGAISYRPGRERGRDAVGEAAAAVSRPRAAPPSSRMGAVGRGGPPTNVFGPFSSAAAAAEDSVEIFRRASPDRADLGVRHPDARSR